ncbi:hypothetical protein NW823_12375, partial [Synechococcus sp. R55.1]
GSLQRRRLEQRRSNQLAAARSPSSHANRSTATITIEVITASLKWRERKCCTAEVAASRSRLRMARSSSSDIDQANEPHFLSAPFLPQEPETSPFLHLLVR